MRVFVTGATGFVGSVVTEELIRGGHQVLGLARSDKSAEWLEKAGAGVLSGDLEDLDSLRKGAADADGVAHLGFVHDFSRFKEVCEIDRLAIEAMGEVLAGTGKPFAITSGTALVNPGHIATEDEASKVDPSVFPRVSERLAVSLVDKDIRSMAIRLSPSVHGEGDHGFVPILINLAREKGLSAYVGEGKIRWTGVHRLDAATLYRLALEKGVAGAYYHGVADEAVEMRAIAELIGKHLNLPVVSKSPEEAAEHFGWFAHFAAIDIPASSKLTQGRLGWKPTHIGLLEDIDQGHYFTV